MVDTIHCFLGLSPRDLPSVFQILIKIHSTVVGKIGIIISIAGVVRSGDRLFGY